MNEHESAGGAGAGAGAAGLPAGAIPGRGEPWG